jgi:YD repeat-containing protein
MRRQRGLHAVATLALATTLLVTSTQTGLGVDPTPTPTPPPTPGQPIGPRGLTPLSPTQGFPIVLPHDGTVLLQVLSSSTAATAAEVGLHLPTRMVLIPNAIASIGQVATVGTFSTNTQLTFYFLLNQIGQEYLSTSDHAKIVVDGPDAWNIGWEDSNDFDYNDVVVRVCFQTPGVVGCPRFPGATFGNGGYGHGPPTTAFRKDPVNTATGNYTSSALDFRLPGRGLAISFTRTYNSLSADVGTLGIGWTYSYAAHLILNGDGSATFVAEDGMQLRFGSDGSGGFLRPPGTYDRLTAAPPGFELLRHDQVTYAFDASGTLTSLTDRNGNEVSLGYTAGRLSSITDSVGRVVSLGYDAQNRLETVSFPPARSVTYGYDPAGRLASVIDARGGTTTYAYDAADRLESITDQSQHRVVLNTYGTDGRVIEQVDARGFHTTFAWDPATEKSTMSDARQGEWVDDYAGGVLVSRTDPLGNVTKYGFTADLFGSFYVDARGYKVETVPDDAGNVLIRTYYHPLFATESATYNSMNNMLTSTDRRGKTTTFTYDAAGNLKTTTGPAPTSPLTTYNYDPTGTGLLFSVIDPRGKTTTYGYDADANRNRITSSLGNTTSMTYDPAGRLETVVEPRGNASGANPADYTTTFTYDPADNPRTTTTPLGHVTTIDYDPAGNRSALTDANTHGTAFEYDEGNHLTAVVDADGKRTEYAYDAVGNLTSRTDANDHVTIYEYDLAKRMTSQTQPLSRVWTYSYDANGNRTKIVDPIASATPTSTDYQVAYTYDEWNRLTRATFFGNGQADYTFDENSNRKTLTDAAGVSTYTYDELNRLKTYRRGTRGLDYLFDAGGNITRRTYTDGTVVDLTYDDDGRLATMSTAGLTTTYGYDPSANLLTTTLPAANGYVETRTYDRSGRLTEVKNQKGANVLSRSTYILDPVGNRMSNLNRTGSDGGSISWRMESWQNTNPPARSSGDIHPS